MNTKRILMIVVGIGIILTTVFCWKHLSGAWYIILFGVGFLIFQFAISDNNDAKK